MAEDTDFFSRLEDALAPLRELAERLAEQQSQWIEHVAEPLQQMVEQGQEWMTQATEPMQRLFEEQRALWAEPLARLAEQQKEWAQQLSEPLRRYSEQVAEMTRAWAEAFRRPSGTSSSTGS